MNQQQTIDQQLAYLKEVYSGLKESEQKDFDTVLASIVQLSKESHETEHNYLKEIKAYLLRKKQRDIKPDINSIFALKSLVTHKNKYDDEIHTCVLSIIWDLLLELSDIKDNKGFYNSLGYYLQIELPENKATATRSEILNNYKQAFEQLSVEEQKKRMQVLAASAFRRATPTELKKFNGWFKK